MPSVSDSVILAAIVHVGFPRESWPTAIAVALAESGGNPEAINSNTNGSTDYGLFQINSIHADLLNENPAWQNPAVNAKMALAISSNGTNWLPWVAYKNGSYLAFLPRAQLVIHTHFPNNKSYKPSPKDYADGAGKAISGGIGGFFDLITDSGTWLRIGFVVVGASLIILALIQANKSTLVNVAKVAVVRKAVKK